MRRISYKLSKADLAIWNRVTQTVSTKHGKIEFAKRADHPTPQISVKQSGRVKLKGNPEQVERPAKPALTKSVVQSAPLDNRVTRELVRGRRTFDGVIDLHGMDQMRAHAALREFLRQAHFRGDRIVLVITGKGRSSINNDSGERDIGVLRRLVPHWLKTPALSANIMGIDEAHERHGGSGALYVRLRKS
jgi:DNA-nicking Smr family endonuclease